MPPSTKRRNRRKDVLPELPDTDALDSSPTRRSVKKRKVEPKPEPHHEQTPDPISGDENEDSSHENEISRNQDLVDSVISILGVAREPVAVMDAHSNARTRQENQESVKAYAKIAGRDWTYYVKSLHVTIGRPPDREQKLDAQSSPVAVAAQSLPEVHIDLGPNKVVSRLHAEIYYDGTEEPPCWRIRVNGRNGARLNNGVLKRGTSAPLKCGDVIEIANTQMMFVTPGDKAVIHPIYMSKLHGLQPVEEPGAWEPVSHAHPEPAASARPVPFTAHGQQKANGRNGVSKAQPVAAVTPSKRQATPATTRPRSRDVDATVKPSPLYNRGMMMESTEEIDYSSDSAKDLKPPYSYANLIGQAIFSTEEEKMSLSNIYKYIMEKYAFYRHTNSGWQNSIRHNLSLNKAFQKVPRRTDEPGKGMKWQIVPEYREEYWKKAHKGMQSSAPSSPIGKDSPSFQKANGQGSFEKRMENPQSTTKPRQTGSPAYHTFSVAPVEAYTPDRGSRAGRSLDAHNPAETPMPSRPRNGEGSRAYGLSDNVAGSPPALSSSYYDDAASSMITPAPLRQQPRLAPPSTAQIPSKFMPMSSPAQFWKFADIGSTPAKPNDISPLKAAGGGGGGDVGRWDGGNAIPSSSPPPPNLGSPSKVGGGPSRTRGRIITPGTSGKEKRRWEDDDDEDGNEAEGFDLARGFQPIGSYHRQLNNAARASASASTS
ncbi:forkhead box protein C2 [Coccidioides immitis RS]|uniref:Forkhead box protein C2 n=1 Tax=Coccidioides immitis (strain RS) TaxID=246410 RepID=A0A0E1RWU2_COCIM|nr:forkhead box protein C2 [Coccidioides immitis RS]EAS32703.2 forkhead box protein C2 [Coccidioides immitis RS]TPX19729.1 transcription factor [Coccidioides immitis]